MHQISRLGKIEAEVRPISGLRAKIFQRGEHAPNVVPCTPAGHTLVQEVAAV